ncbi:MAG TPA: efflux RND transporter periplasmic adaptor subunit, partial [Terriglobia bacterium]|nr:efflux RND transporter periplasmic adaptor subunit [Terriglobia bacterium]
IARVKRGQKVLATLDAYPDWHIPSHVRTIIPTADRDKGTVKVRISFDKLDPRILPDMGVKVAFLSQSNSAKKAKSQGPAARAIIPQAAVRGTGDGSYVFTVRNGKIERRAVTLGQTIPQGIQVMAGVNPGDELVVRGPGNLKDGMSVQIRQ